MLPRSHPPDATQNNTFSNQIVKRHPRQDPSRSGFGSPWEHIYGLLFSQGAKSRC